MNCSYIARPGAQSTRAKLHRMLALVLIAALLAAITAVVAQDTLLMPKGSGQAVEGDKGTRIDYGNSAEGYVIVQQKPGDKGLMLMIAKGDSNYTYTLNNQGYSETYPLQMGNGRYKVQVYQQVEGNQYKMLDSATFDVSLNAPSQPYLYPSQYVNYTANSQAVSKANELCKNARSERDAVNAVFNFIKKNIKYDKKLAKKVQQGYIPDVDTVLRTRKGICFGYAALMACMLRSQGIPTQLVIGYVNGKYYHAWNKVYIGGSWELFDPTFAVTKTKGKNYSEDRRY